MLNGKVCAKHPELLGRRHNGGNCPECLKVSKAAYRERNREKILKEMADYRAANTGRLREVNARWRAENKEHIRSLNLKRMGFTLALFETAMRLQEGKCAICSKDLAKMPSRHTHADHCHATGLARGVLCHHCNTGLGAFKDDARLLAAAANYLENPTIKREEIK